MGQVLEFPTKKTYRQMLPEDWQDPENPTHYELACTLRTLREIERDLWKIARHNSGASVIQDLDTIKRGIALIYSYYRSD